MGWVGSCLEDRLMVLYVRTRPPAFYPREFHLVKWAIGISFLRILISRRYIDLI